jgi:hypothetical protein
MFGILLLFVVGAINVINDPMRIEEEEKKKVESEYV